MRKLVVTENMTLDGVIDMAQGWFDPLAEDVDQSDIAAANREHQQAADALLVGRNTFVSFREFRSKQTDDPTGVSDYLNAVAKYVVSRSSGRSRLGDTLPCCGARWRKRCKRSSRHRVGTSSPRAASSSSMPWSPRDWSTSTGCSCSR